MTEPATPPRFGRNLLVRFITALPLAAAVVAMIVYSSYGLFAFCSLVGLAALIEFYALLGLRWHRPVVAISLLAALCCWSVLLLGISMQHYVLGPIIPPLLLVLTPAWAIALLFDKQVPSAINAMGFLLVGWVYVMLPLVLLYLLGHPPGQGQHYQFALPLGILLILWANDVGAYFAGKFFGRHRLFARISPGKTWQGAAGGLLGALLLAFGTQLLWPVQGVSWYLVAAIIVVFGTLGDLVESQLKRQLGLKDSGGLLPGHGGLLDRFDGLLLAMPPLFLYILYAQG